MQNKLSNLITDLLEECQWMDMGSNSYQSLNGVIRKEIRGDITNHNTQLIHRTTEENTNIRVLQSKTARGKMQIQRMRISQFLQQTAAKNTVFRNLVAQEENKFLCHIER